MFKGLDTRLEAEVRHLVNKSVMDDVKVIAPNERKFSVWMGAAILASLTSFLTEWITKEEYEEHGPNIVHRRCCLLYTSDAADEEDSVDLGGCRIIKKKNHKTCSSYIGI
eukprot:TRINITY_DN34757_c0_g1_i1.p2 TRINITY_DN34757_c0_g1~~TRINITY_DN34757_c0_g1_i1.p2  ORF type:complete len:110 (-),score=27.09 TRINITY_DN34757_c0_g1_i1:91-420(-)